MNNVISLDFDFWANLLNAAQHDWGAREAPFFINDIWPIRAISSMSMGIDLRAECSIASDEPSPILFADVLREHNLKVSPNGIALAESHAAAYDWFKRMKNLHIIHIDAHHDLGYNRSDYEQDPVRLADIECGNWMLALVRSGCVKKITIVYPKWRLQHDNEWEESRIHIMEAVGDTELEVHFGLDEWLPMDLKIKKMFVCRSGAWTPPWLDGDFQDLVSGLMSINKHITFYPSNLGGSFKSMFEGRKIDWREIEKCAVKERGLVNSMRSNLPKREKAAQV